MFGVDSRARTGMGDVLQVWIQGPLPRGCRGPPWLSEGWRRRPSQLGLPDRKYEIKADMERRGISGLRETLESRSF